jgi:hypothetical protein
MLKYQTTLGERLRKVLEVISPILVDGNLTFSKDGLRIRGMTNNVMVNLHLPPSGAESIENWGEDISIGLDFKSLCGWMKAVTKGDIISFSVTKEVLESSNPTLVYKHWNDRKNHEVLLPILDIEEFKAPVQDTKYDSVLAMPSLELDNYLKLHGLRGDRVRLQTIDDSQSLANGMLYLVMHSIGSTPAETTQACRRPSYIPKEYKVGHRACPKQETFNIKTLRSISKAYVVSDTVNVFVGMDKPLMLSYRLGQMGSVEFRVTPMPEEEEQEEPVLSPKKKRKRKITRKKLDTHKAVVVKQKKKKQKIEKTDHYPDAQETDNNYAAGIPETPKNAKKPKRRARPVCNPSQRCEICGDLCYAGQELGHVEEDPWGLYHRACIPPEAS